MIDSILIANRGEIACRIIRACRNLGIRAIALYSDADSHARHVHEADEAVHIGPAPSADSYLAIEKIIAAAQRTAAHAIHPGFGFLAENAQFAYAVRAAGLIFIGPHPSAIEAMGSKRAAKEIALSLGIPTLPGYNDADQSDPRLTDEAARIGVPLMVKAAAGGGGKGMRLVDDLAQLPAALSAARREALQAFGSSDLILERDLVAPRHIEIQVLGDPTGTILHLGERECSIQRRHQKIIEEAPAVAPELRARMGADAVRAAQAVGYVSAGTVEFLVDAAGQHYFLEMNTRLQVEHPVTELVTGIDLVEWQIRIADGEALPFRQEDIVLRGHAVEARIYAENPANDFLPVTGDIALWQPPDGVRVDSGLNAQDSVSIHYDPMLVKLIAHGETRAIANRKLAHALQNTVLLGIPNNIRFLIDILRHPAYHDGDLSTGFLQQHFSGWQPPAADVALALITAAVLARPDSANYWRTNPNRPEIVRFALDGAPTEVFIAPLRWQAGVFTVRIADSDRASTVIPQSITPTSITLVIDGHRRTLRYAAAADRLWLHTPSGVVTLDLLPLLPVPKPTADSGGSLRAPMPGAVTAVLVEVGQQVEKGQPLLKLEAMKMEHTITAAGAGLVEEIYYRPGDTVDADAQLIRITGH